LALLPDIDELSEAVSETVSETVSKTGFRVLTGEPATTDNREPAFWGGGGVSSAADLARPHPNIIPNTMR